ncbi:MAG: hypothetical protein HYU99_10775 [Deltaproteobacteria bacterium]|nr:hypothetical protein [Deltaproteobacteria bacterium]
MIYERKPAFDRLWDSLTPIRKEKAREALEKLVHFFEGGPRSEGLGLKKLKSSFWEIRTDLKDRILFSLRKNVVAFVLIGNHDEIHRFLKRA